MTEWEGQVSKKSDTDWHGVKLYKFQIEGTDRWFSTGQEDIEAEIGTWITFQERNAKVDKASVSVVQPSTAPSVSVSTGHVPSAVEVARLTEELRTESRPDVGRRIQWQAARRDACNVIIAALHTEALPWASNVAKAKKLDLLRGYINELTTQFIEEEA